ncbi:MAG: ATP synthase F1 subunit delta [Acidobacteria bacterium]|nr:ATP synthase F1 subunit delta [Acidobacteriota bacterium]MBS1864536.1 ATP synthase F1 subunit delta [Acidobacteriota bacterium]
MKSASLQYANALADVALQQGAADAAQKQLSDFAGAYAESAELRNFLASPAVTVKEKHAVAEKIAARIGGSKILRNFLFLVIDHHRTHMLSEIADAFRTVIRERQGIAEAKVLSAVEMSEPQKKVLTQSLEKKTGKKIEARFAVDKELLGGIVVRIGDTVYDGSVRHRLDEMKAALAAE